MAESAQAPDDARASERLDSWKEIAAFLGRDVRTVQRWERLERLPVHRHVHRERSHVYAYRSEVARWLDTRRAEGQVDVAPLADSATLRPRSIVMSAIVVALLGVFLSDVGGHRVASVEAPASWAETRLLDAVTRPGVPHDVIHVERGYHRMALAPDGREMYVTSASITKDVVSIVDLASRQVVAAWPVTQPSALVLSRDGSHAYVGQMTGDIIDLDTRGRTIRTIVTNSRVRDLALSPDGRALFVAAEASGLLRVDVATGTVHPVSALACPMGLALSPQGDRLYVNYQCYGAGGRPGHDAIDVLDTASMSSIGSILGLPNIGGRLAMAHDGAYLWADGMNACMRAEPEFDRLGCPDWRPVVNVIRMSDRAPVRSVAVGHPDDGNVLGISLTPDGSRATVATISRLEILSTSTLKPIEIAEVPAYGAVAFSSDGRTAYVTAGGDGSEILVTSADRTIMPSALVGRWSGDGTANDVRSSRDGTVKGGVRFVPGCVGQAFELPGADAAVEVSASGFLGLTARPFTLLGWIRMRPTVSPAASTVFDQLEVTDTRRTGLRLIVDQRRRLAACVAAASDACDARTSGHAITGATEITPGTWHQVGARWSDGELTLVLDGRADTRASLPIEAINPDELLRFGSDPRGRMPFAGAIDEVEFYERALTAAEILRRFDAVRAGGSCAAAATMAERRPH